jgi:subtilisin family serine protease
MQIATIISRNQFRDLNSVYTPSLERASRPEERRVHTRLRSAPRRWVEGLLFVAIGALLLMIVAVPARASSAERHIVVLEQDVGQPGEVARQHSRRHAAEVRFVYRHAVNGYAAEIPPSELAELRRDPRVRLVEADGRVSASTTQSGATWGLDRIDQRSLPLSGTFSYANTGSGVRAYIVDTGIRLSHSEFAGRAVNGYDAVENDYSAGDCNGHGTHVAGTTGGSSYGVAKQSTLVAVRVLDCSGSGTYSGVIAGVDWVTADHLAGQPAVANMSLGGGVSSALEMAVKNSVADGVTYAVAAGNDSRDACRFSPARVPEAITVSATANSDSKPSWANYGSCVDLFAPGVGIRSAWHTGDTATSTISGTSMATPHAAGVAALYLESNATAAPQQVRDALYADATKGIVKRSKTVNNHLLFTSR